MATGYTYALYDGTPITFEVFMWRLARAMDVLAHMRDAATDTPISLPLPEERRDTYHDERLKEERARLRDFRQKTDADWAADVKSFNKKNLAEYKRHKKEEEERERRYNEMIKKVTAWSPPSQAHERLKAFALQQLADSVEMDCRHYSSMPAPKKLTGEEYKAMKLGEVNLVIDYHAGRVKKTRSSAAEREEWIRQLADSIPLPEEMKGEGW